MPAARVRGRGGEAAVSDVLGSILLVGMTVIMAVAFGGLLLAFEGPADTQHTQLGVTVGPGADGDWGTNDAELKILHLGGEELKQSDVTVRYTDLDGPHTVSPTFTGGKLSIGGSWTQVVSATPGLSVPVTVSAHVNDGSVLVSSGSVSAGGAGATLTYVNSITPAAGKGAVLNFANAQLDIPADSSATFEEGSVGGSSSSSTLAPTTATNSGASNNNVLASDDSRSTLDGSGEYVQASGFNAPGGGLSISAISMGVEARTSFTTQTVTHVATTTGSSSGVNTVSTAAILPSTGEVLVAAIANGNTGLRTVSSISGPLGGSYTWTKVGDTGANSAGTGRLEVWVGTGTPPLVAGIVTATFSGAADRAGISVSRYSGVDTSNIVQASTVGESAGNGGTTAVSLGPIAGTATNGVFFAAVNGVGASSNNNGCAFTTPSNERADFDPGGGDKVQLCAAGGTAAASNTLSATINSASDWQAVILTLRPYAPALPSIKLTWSGPSGTPSVVTQALTATDTQYTFSILADRAWVPADISSVAVRATYETDTGADVEVDQIFLAVTVATSPTTYTGQADIAFVNVPDEPTQQFQMRYKTNGGDTFRVYALTGAIENPCAGTLGSVGVYAVFTCTLTSAEYNLGSPVLRIKDVTPGGSTKGILTIDYARMSSS